jgi:hypothetical protein
MTVAFLIQHRQVDEVTKDPPQGSYVGDSKQPLSR